MCVTFLYYGQSPLLVLLLAFNRDEFIERPTRPVHVWGNKSNIIGGRDLKAGGTWLGVSKLGRLALLTNYREFPLPSGEKSRGQLVVDFLEGKREPQNFIQESDLTLYGGLNLIIGNPYQSNLMYTSNRNQNPIEHVPHGIHALSNGRLNDSWYKVQKGKKILQQIMAEYGEENSTSIPWERIFSELLGSDQRVEPGFNLPSTGLPDEIEEQLSSIFIPTFQYKEAPYGTVSQSIIAFWRDGTIEWREKYLDSQDREWKFSSYIFQTKQNQYDNGPDKIEL